jgi:hypothetical protein
MQDLQIWKTWTFLTERVLVQVADGWGQGSRRGSHAGEASTSAHRVFDARRVPGRRGHRGSATKEAAMQGVPGRVRVCAGCASSART